MLSGEVTRDGWDLRAEGGRESSLAGCLAAKGAILDAASRSLGSSKGLMLELGVSTEAGDRDKLESVGVCRD